MLQLHISHRALFVWYFPPKEPKSWARRLCSIYWLDWCFMSFTWIFHWKDTGQNYFGRRKPGSLSGNPMTIRRLSQGQYNNDTIPTQATLNVTRNKQHTRPVSRKRREYKKIVAFIHISIHAKCIGGQWKLSYLNCHSTSDLRMQVYFWSWIDRSNPCLSWMYSKNHFPPSIM